MSKNYNLHCVVCGSEFQVSRRDAHTCSDECRLALSTMYKKMDKELKHLTPEERETLKALQDKLAGRGKTLNTILGKKAEPVDKTPIQDTTDAPKTEPTTPKTDDKNETPPVQK